ncbi:MAG: hypothetical protein SOU49_12150 [Sodaliphilus pleomorphus]|jgi:hypothetical protein|uniref:hypothetical protein n=1 Tax=Sodaliphilus pleomorphus TaxID=2606626 RepID=UPI002A74C2CA|nr:hypothetical protein [Sodaliphilus pleomorphus]MDY2833472.1 hypothetical protein [Sodaliphilus pleomorphus]MDY4950916.1 hypothetical protein [Prevotella sp.]
MDTIMQILQWAIPSGGIGAAIAWVANRKANNAKQAKSVHDTYKAMYEDISALLVETQRKYDDSTKLTEKLVSENNLTRRALNRLSRAIEAIQLCPHAGTCPVSGELSMSQEDDEGGDTAAAGHEARTRRGRIQRGEKTSTRAAPGKELGCTPHDDGLGAGDKRAEHATGQEQ